MPTSTLVEDELLYLDAGWQVARGVHVAGPQGRTLWVDWVVMGRGSLIAIAVARNLGQREVDDLLLSTGYGLIDATLAMPVDFDHLIVALEGVIPAGGRRVEFELPERGVSLSVVYATELQRVLEEIDEAMQVRDEVAEQVLEQLLTASEVQVEELTHC